GYKKISGLTKTVPWVYRSPAQIKNIIINPKYYGDFTGIHGTLKNFLPAIVSKDIFEHAQAIRQRRAEDRRSTGTVKAYLRSEEHTSELQSRFDLVCRLLLEKKNLADNSTTPDTTD